MYIHREYIFCSQTKVLQFPGEVKTNDWNIYSRRIEFLAVYFFFYPWFVWFQWLTLLCDNAMRLLVKKALVRTALFFTCGCLGGLLFWSIEDQEDQMAVKEALLLSLKNAMTVKYNMTAEEFENFTRLSFEAQSRPKPAMSIENAIEFSFSAITTIGEWGSKPSRSVQAVYCICILSREPGPLM